MKYVNDVEAGGGRWHLRLPGTRCRAALRARHIMLRLCRYSTVLFLTLLGCQFTPSPTSKAVGTNDVVGLWSFTEVDGKTMVTVLITFYPSGVFTQEVLAVSQTNRQAGRWSLEGPHVQLTDFLRRDVSGWKKDSMHWYFVDGSKGGVELFGGAFPDDDAFQYLKHLRTIP
jgi:hypothetical protein